MSQFEQRVCADRSSGSVRRPWTRFGAQALIGLLALTVFAAIPAAAQHRVSGRVTSVGTGAALAGAQVGVKGTSVGTQTDSDGRYVLQAPSGEGTLIFSLIGYTPQEAAIGGRSEINARLAATVTELEGLVVVGYGEKKQVNLTESVGVVSSAEIQKVAVASPDQAIQGRVPGVQIQSQSGAPGSPVSVRIRGVGTIGNTQPLFIIDGVPVGRGRATDSNPLATINPADIENISVLKDASAAAVYGVQAANGVVLITTKRGKLGKPTVRYDGYTGVQQMPRYYDVLGSDEWYAHWTEANNNYNAYMGYKPGSKEYLQLPVRIRPGHPDAAGLLAVNTDWQRLAVHNNAPITNHNVSVSGASDNVNYYVSAGYFAQDAIQHKWDLDRINFRANSDFKVNDRIRFGETFSVSNQFTLRGQHGWGDGRILHNTVRMSPIYQFRDPSCATEAGCPNNRYGFASNMGVFDFVRGNQLAINEIRDVEDRSTRVLGGLHGEVDLLKGLTFRSQGNLDYRIDRFYDWNPGFAAHEVGLDRNAPVAEDQRGENYGVVLTNTLTYDGSLGSHNFNVLGGIETQQYHWDNVNLKRTTFLSVDENVRRIVGGSGGITNGAWAGETAFLGYLGRLNYNFADRYLVTATVRRDGASTFAPGYQWGTFPSLSAGWRISQEPFFQVPWVNELKVRASWGELGNSEIEGGAYPHLLAVGPNSTYTLNGWDFADVPIPSVRVPNPALTWESTTTTDLGIEGTLFDNAVDFAVTYYDKSTGGFLLNMDLPPSSGFLRSPFNSGEVKNTGVELELGYSPLPIFGDLELQISGNLTTVNNRLISLAEGMEEYTAALDRSTAQNFANIYRTSIGQPIGYFYGYKTCGIFQTPEAAAAAPVDKTTNRRPGAGDLCFQDLDADGVITTKDRTFLGSAIPDMYYGLNLNAVWRGLDMTAFFNGVQGVEKFNMVRRDLEHLGGGGDNQMRTVLNRWTGPGTSNTMPRAIARDPAGNNRFSNRWVEDASYFRLRTLQLGYTLPDGFLGTNGTRVYLSGQNLFTLTGYSGYDPEFTTSIDNWRSRNDLALFSGTDTGDMPTPRMFQIGVSTAF